MTSPVTVPRVSMKWSPLVVVLLLMAAASLTLNVYQYYSPKSVAETTTAYSTEYLSGAYSTPIAYRAPVTWAPIGTCGLWSVFDAPIGSQYGGPQNVPITTVVALTYYGVFNQTSSCPVLRFLTVSVTAPGYNSTVRLLVVRTLGNSSVYGASLTFTSNIGLASVNLRLIGLPSGYHDLTQTSVYFNLLTSGDWKTTQYANDTVLYIG